MADVGAYGKIPSLGDFFRIGADHAFIDPWDTWLQAGLIASRQKMRDDWGQYYLSAPIWRFSLSAGLAGSRAVLGVLMPSVDRVGRKFPLTLMAAATAPVPALDLHFRSRELYEALEDVALNALNDQSGRAEIVDGLAGLSPVPGPAPTRVFSGSGWLKVSAGPKPVAALSAHFAGQNFRQPSVWSTGIEPDRRLMIIEGMPDPSNFHAFLNLDAAFWQEPDDFGATS